jgi:O-antigen/teichoic acid export membrane protein
MAIQAVNVLTGFLLLRWLSITAYAQFSVAFAFQSTFGMLIDLGFSNSIVALVGDRGTEATVVGSYIRTARHLRNRIFVIMIGIAVVAFPIITYRQPWGIVTKLVLFCAIVSSLFFQGWGMYAAPLLIHQRLKLYYRAQLSSSIVRFLLCALFHAVGALSAIVTSWLAAIALAINGLLNRQAARELAAEPSKSNAQINREMLRYLAPLIPGIIFTAFQGQITIGIITIFGQTKSIADVAALGRLGQLFLLLGAFNSVIVEPYIAQVASRTLTRRYWQMFTLALVIGGCISAFAFKFPGLLIWLLGPKYYHLRSEVGLVVLGSCINYIAGVIWVMNSARKWIFWWYTSLYIGCVLLSQVACAVTLNLHTTHGVILFSVITGGTVVLAHLAGGIYGLARTVSTINSENLDASLALSKS